MRFLLDENIPRSSLTVFRELDQEAEHVSDMGLRGIGDEEIIAYAKKKKSIVITREHLGWCPAEAARGVVTKGLVSVYAQHRERVDDGDEPTRTGRSRLSPVGVLCVSCGYHQIDPATIANR